MGCEVISYGQNKLSFVQSEVKRCPRCLEILSFLRRKEHLLGEWVFENIMHGVIKT